MAFYENKRSVLETDKPEQYRVLREIGDVPPSPGIYECQTCKYEDVEKKKKKKLPPRTNRKKKGHSNKWKLLVKATDK